jgi:hypothetical protein
MYGMSNIKWMLHSIRKADCVARTISGTLSAEGSRTLLFVTTYMQQFYNFANFAKEMRHPFPPPTR